MPIEFSETTVTDDDNDETSPPESTDLACEVCGTPLVYAGRGRKPKRCAEHKSSGSSAGSLGGPRGGAGRGSASVEQAVATLGNLYDAVGLAFLLASTEDYPAATIWTAQVPELQTRNRQILQGDPELVKAINRLGVKGGKFAFAAAQIAALTPPLMVASVSLRERQAARTAAQRRANMRQQNTSAAGTPPTGTGTGGPTVGNRDFFG